MNKLHKDLADSIVNVADFRMVHHPLMICHYTDNEWLIDDINTRYEQKLKLVESDLKDKKFGQYLFCHERPYRVGALMHLVSKEKMNDKKYWDLVSYVWIDSENIFENRIIWRWLLNHQRGNSHLMMDKEEKKYFDGLPDKIKIYRGGMDDKGFSWTLDKQKAEWFANRWAMNSNWGDRSNIDGEHSTEVFTKTINKTDALAYLNGRNEQEIVYIPE